MQSEHDLYGIHNAVLNLPFNYSSSSSGRLQRAMQFVTKKNNNRESLCDRVVLQIIMTIRNYVSLSLTSGTLNQSIIVSTLFSSLHLRSFKKSQVFE